MSEKTGNTGNLEWLCLAILNQVSCQSQETCLKCSRWGKLLSECPAENPSEIEVMETRMPKLRTPKVKGNHDTCSESRLLSSDILVYMNSLASDCWRPNLQYISTDLVAHGQNLTQQKQRLHINYSSVYWIRTLKHDNITKAAKVLKNHKRVWVGRQHKDHIVLNSSAIGRDTFH